MKNFKKLLTIFATAAILFVSCGNASVDANGCYYDIDDAVKAAEKNNKDILIVATVDEKDSPSEDFLNKIVRVPEFKKEIASKYCVVCMDFSESKFSETVVKDNATDKEKKVSEEKAEILKKNTGYAAKLNIVHTPVVYILSKEQYVITGFFYEEEERSFEGFKTILDEKAALVADMHKMIYQTKIGTAEEKVAAINALYDSTSPDYRYFLIDLIDSVKKLDPSNKSQLLGKFIDSASELKSNLALINGDVRGAVQAYLDIENEEAVPAESRQLALYTAAYMCANSGLEDNAVVIDYLERAVKLAPDSEDVPAIRRVIEALSAQ